ncbi:unnamed protein product [Pedinophyceae sp. YPF-701]|nr:unnamed protein product [Pedinophyceae sp. YPF-701]
MANFEHTDLMAVGEHCAMAECSQLDFLPFKCTGCRRTFCLEHRQPAAHQCPKASDVNPDVIVCPLCAKAVRVNPGGDVNQAWDLHARTDCDPSNYAKVHKKPRCPAPRCREKLVTSNTYECPTCHTKVCLKHRFAKDHECEERVAAQRRNKPSSFMSMFSRAAAPSGPAARTQPRPQPAATATAAARSHRSKAMAVAAERRAAATQSRGAPRAAGRPQGGGVLEECGACGRAFATTAELVEHVETVHFGVRHPKATGNVAVYGSQDRCPKCGVRILDPVALVGHVEGCRPRTAQRTGEKVKSFFKTFFS